GQAADIDRHAEVAAQQSTGVGAIGGQSFTRGLLAFAGDQVQDGFGRRAAHACTSARRRVQRFRKEPEPLPRVAASAEVHGAQRERWLPERRSQILPQRSQYFSSILCGREDSNFEIIVFLPFFKTKAPAAARPQRLRELDSRQAVRTWRRQGSIIFRRPVS